MSWILLCVPERRKGTPGREGRPRRRVEGTLTNPFSLFSLFFYYHYYDLFVINGRAIQPSLPPCLLLPTAIFSPPGFDLQLNWRSSCVQRWR